MSNEGGFKPNLSWNNDEDNDDTPLEEAELQLTDLLMEPADGNSNILPIHNESHATNVPGKNAGKFYSKSQIYRANKDRTLPNNGANIRFTKTWSPQKFSVSSRPENQEYPAFSQEDFIQSHNKSMKAKNLRILLKQVLEHATESSEGLLDHLKLLSKYPSDIPSLTKSAFVIELNSKKQRLFDEWYNNAYAKSYSVTREFSVSKMRKDDSQYNILGEKYELTVANLKQELADKLSKIFGDSNDLRHPEYFRRRLDSISLLDDIVYEYLDYLIAGTSIIGNRLRRKKQERESLVKDNNISGPNKIEFNPNIAVSPSLEDEHESNCSGGRDISENHEDTKEVRKSNFAQTDSLNQESKKRSKKAEYSKLPLHILPETSVRPLNTVREVDLYTQSCKNDIPPSIDPSLSQVTQKQVTKASFYQCRTRVLR